MKKAAIVFLSLLALVFSLNDQAYLNGFAGQLGLTQDQTTANINCFNAASTEINDMRVKIAANPLTIEDNTIYDWVQQIKYILMRKCPTFESDTKSYFVQNTKAPVLSEAPCNSMSSYNNQIKQSLLAWSFDLSSGQDEEAGKMHAYIYQILFGVVNPLIEPVASFTYTLSGLTFSFDAGASVDPDGSIVDYSWDFGNPSGSSNTASGTSSTVSHTYATPGTYTVTLKVTDNSGNSATTTSTAKINVAPTASFVYSISGTTITFDASGSVDSDGTIATYAWNFGESGSHSNSVSVATSSISHVYASYGTYTIILTVIDNDGATATQTQTIKINSPPTVSLMTSVMKRTVSFDSSASTDSDGGIVSYAWNFGEPSSSSNTASTVTATHTYSGPGAFTVTLIITDTDGAAVTKTKSITVLANQAPTATFTPTLSVSSKTVTFNAGGSTDSDGSIVNYSWNFGESSSSSNTASGSTTTATHTYTSTGTYTVTLTVTDDEGATTTVSKSVKINAAPVASFTYSVSRRTVTFDASTSTDLDGGIVKYDWNFGEPSSDKNIASKATPGAGHIYAAAGGTFTVTLTVTDSDGATTTITKSVTVAADIAPIASFTFSVSGKAVSFNAGASTDSDGNIVTYAWNFGESGSSSNTASGTGSTASHTYLSPGTYTVVLTVTDNEGTTNSLSKAVKINAPPTASFTYTISGKTVTFDASGSTDSDGTITNYKWNFGEPSSSSNIGSGSVSSASHTYATYGIYTVTLTVTDNDGALTTLTKSIRINTPPTASFTASINKRVVSFDASASTDSDGSIASYAWNFGESSSSSNTASGAFQTPTHTYSSAGGTFTVTLTVTDSDGATATTTKSITIAANVAPTASFTYTITGNTIAYNAGASADSDGSISNYAWTFGESSSYTNTASGASSTTSHTYASPGTYTVVLTVTDNEGAMTTQTKSIKINTPPTASFTYSINKRVITFNAGASTDSDGSITAYSWNFGESSSSSNTASGSTATHTYAPAGGTFTVTLAVTDNDGATTTTTQSITITADIAPTASFIYTITGNTISYNAGGSTDSDGSIVTYAWNFGEPSSSSNTASSSTSSTSHTYATPGTYTVILTVTDNEGVTSTQTKSIRINAPPTASFTYSINRRVVTFNAGASTDSDGSITAYSWNFGESSSSSNTASGSTATHTYAPAGGTFTVTLTVTDNDGAMTTTTQSITIAANVAPTASFTQTLSGFTLSFNAGASTDSDGSIVTYAWNFGESSSSSNTAYGTSTTASHTYASYGTYTITLTVTDNEGATNTFSKSVKINAPPTASFTQTISGTTITFSAAGSTDSDGTIATYAWTFGESSSSSNTASSSTSGASHTYATYGTYTVILTVTDSDGATNTITKSIRINAPPVASFTYSISRRVVTFNAGASTDSDGSITAYSWNFGESSSGTNTASGSTSTHTYAPAGGTFTVTLTVTDNDGATSTTTRSFTIAANVAPTASFTQTLSSFTISFNAGASADSDGSIVTYAWNFGESSSSSNTASGTSTTASHIYASYGTYTITLTVTDNEGATNTFSKSVKINAPPTASFTQTISGTTISFNAGGSTDSDGSIVTYAWTFGEPSSSSNTASSSTSGASHTYAATGTYTVTLTVTDSDGATNTITKSIRINAPPTASFTYTISRRVVTFNAGASTDSDGSITAYSWNFGESSSSSNTASGSTSTHTYAPAGGTFTVTLTVTDNDGATSTTTRSFTIVANVAPTASIAYTTSVGGNQITFDASGSTDSDGTIVNYSWNFGESSSSSNTASSSSSSAIHVYSISGTYTVTLQVTDNEGATATTTKIIGVSSNCANQFHIIASWTMQGDYDIIVKLPNGNYIGYWNKGPDSSTSYGKLIADSVTNENPEETCWQSPYVPPSGTYLICLNPYNPSGGLPSVVTVTVIKNSVATVYLKTETAQVRDQSCSTTSSSFVTSVTYP